MKLFFTLILSVSVSFLYAQKVGIGLTNPQEKLHVDSSIKIGVGAWTSSIHNRFFKIGDGNNVTIGEVGLDDRLEFSAREFLFRNSGGYPGSNGKVGININTSPTAFLEVNGDVKITDGNQGAGKVFTSASDGTGSWQNLPAVNSAFHAKLQSANLIISPATDYVVVFDTETFDDGQGYNSSNGFFVAPSEGTYSFNVKIQWILASSTQAQLSVSLELNGSKIEEAKDDITSSSGNDSKTISFSTVIKLNALDVLKVIVRQDSGNNQEVSTTSSSFSGHRIY